MSLDSWKTYQNMTDGDKSTRNRSSFSIWRKAEFGPMSLAGLEAVGGVTLNFRPAS